jgi:hypothetical protein
MKKTVLTLALAALLVVPGLVSAQDDPSSYIWINYVKAKAGQGEALTQTMIEEDSKIFNPMVDSGAALDWGIGLPVIHDEGVPYSHVQWIVFSGWAGADAFMGEFMKMQEARSEEERAALQAKFEAATEEGSHADDIYRIVHIGPGEDRPGYINLGFYTAKPGKMGDAKTFYDDIAVPVYDKLKADGAINSYGLAVPAIHRGDEYTHMGWYSSANLATRDVVEGAFDAAEAARSEEENEAIGERWLETFDPKGHEDQILLVVHHYAGGGDGE